MAASAGELLVHSGEPECVVQEAMHLAQCARGAVPQPFSDFADAAWTCDRSDTGRPTFVCVFWLTTVDWT